jgi:glycosyltransferase involved in cell wall biosynthesis
VHFLGTLTKPDLNDAYNASELFAITSTSDTQSLVMMQALAAGIPVIAVNARSLPEYVNEKNGAIVPPNNPDALAREIIRLLKDKKARIELGKGARSSAEQYSPPAIAKEWEGIYRQAIGDYHRARERENG